ncbi:metallophosphoesterase [Pseudenhygromyxa sp. WMMC2535]|uniref:metallophosphoesterase n=1 Tax=Pseudenhygromyxa sp. WMMC2535 TaxID=2712867 RepID=UPI001555C0C0|nr:metallophosphoesterase [Pseudenhygromyxa sp. WMMC2535]NVB39648.1 metallophosphoesterase [Pseudenhygromyxa sp. WMMC2535]
MRWIVGDLQGCAREFERLLETIHFDPARDQLFAAGDLINRGPDSLATLRLWRAVGGLGVIGNHEVYALCARSGRWPRKHDTLDALFAAPDADELLAELRALPALRFLPGEPKRTGGTPDVWLVHAGLDPRWSDLHALADALAAPPHDDDWLLGEDLSFATRVRCCTAEGERSRFDRQPEDCPPPYRPWDEFYEGDALVVHGHWAWRGHYRGPRTLGLDSGCVYGGPLTAWCMEEDRVVQIPNQSQG